MFTFIYLYLFVFIWSSVICCYFLLCKLFCEFWNFFWRTTNLTAWSDFMIFIWHFRIRENFSSRRPLSIDAADASRTKLFSKGGIKAWISVTRLGDLLHFGQLFKACDNNYFAKIAHILAIFKGVKIFHFSREIIFGQLFIDIWWFLLVTLALYQQFCCYQASNNWQSQLWKSNGSRVQHSKRLSNKIFCLVMTLFRSKS